jgi:hypothetical protein
MSCSARLRFPQRRLPGVGAVLATLSLLVSRIGPFLVSDVLTTWTGPTGPPRMLALGTLPPTATALRAILEIYPAPGERAPTDLRVRFALSRGQGDVVSPVSTHEVEPSLAGTTLSASATLPAAALASGEYDIQATILKSGMDLGSASTSFRKGS